VSAGAAYTRVFKCPTCKNPEDSNLAWSVEAMQWFLLHLSIVMIGVTENISHSTAKMCWGTIIQSFNCNSQIKYVRTHVDVDIFS
jgi:hypothetical protein